MAFKTEKHYNLSDRFFEAFAGSKCKTALLAISILIVFTFCLTELLKVFYEVRNEGLRDIVMCVILFWIGRASKTLPNGK